MELAALLLGAGTLWATPCSAFCVPVPASSPRDFSDFYEYTKSHVGRWRGLWRTYDSEGVEQGDPDRMDTAIDLSSDGKTLSHANTLFVGSVDSECTTCHDSVETRDIPVGTYTKETFRQRAAWLGLWCGDAKILDDEAGGSLAWKEEAVPPSHLRTYI
eukprot:g6841.t1